MRKTIPKIYMNPDGVWRDYSKIVRGAPALIKALDALCGINYLKSLDREEKSSRRKSNGVFSKD
jgi:hypothetical protein